GESGEADFRVDVAFNGVSAHPADTLGVRDAALLRSRPGTPDGETALLTDLSGAFTVTDDRLEMQRLEGVVAPGAGGAGGAPFSGTVDVAFPRRAGEDRRVTESIEVELVGRGIEVARPLERVLDAA